MNTNETTYQNLCAAFDSIEFKYDKHPDKLSVSCVCGGGDLKINIFVKVNPDSNCVTFYSALPFPVKKEKTGEIALTVCYINNKLKFGKFDFDMETGSLDYNFCNYYEPDAASSVELLKDLIMVAIHTVDKYNGKLQSIDSGLLSFTEFMQADKGTLPSN